MTDMKVIYADDGSHTIDVGDGIVFGPYGPGECEAVHPSGMKCRHGKRHVGCHSTFDFSTPAGQFKHRWWDKETT